MLSNWDLFRGFCKHFQKLINGSYLSEASRECRKHLHNTIRMLHQQMVNKCVDNRLESTVPNFDIFPLGTGVAQKIRRQEWFVHMVGQVFALVFFFLMLWKWIVLQRNLVVFIDCWLKVHSCYGQLRVLKPTFQTIAPVLNVKHRSLFLKFSQCKIKKRGKMTDKPSKPRQTKQKNLNIVTAVTAPATSDAPVTPKQNQPAPASPTPLAFTTGSITSTYILYNDPPTVANVGPVQLVLLCMTAPLCAQNFCNWPFKLMN